MAVCCCCASQNAGRDRREPTRVDHELTELIKTRTFAIACGNWLMHALRNADPKTSLLSTAEFGTLRLRLIKIAARVVERASRIRVFLPTSCPEQTMFASTAKGCMPAEP